MLKRFSALVVALALSGCATSTPPLNTAKTLIDEAIDTLHQFSLHKELKNYKQFMDDAAGVVILPEVIKAGWITGAEVAPGHVLIGLASNGLHTNGYSLARKVLFDTCGHTVDTELPGLDGSLGDVLLRPHLCYYPAIRKALDDGLPLHGIAHITGGGLYDNIPRVLPSGVAAEINSNTFDCPPIFKIIREAGGISDRDMFHAFNMGIGMVWMVPAASADAAIATAVACGFRAMPIGSIVSGDKGVRIDGEG